MIGNISIAWSVVSDACESEWATILSLIVRVVLTAGKEISRLSLYFWSSFSAIVSLSRIFGIESWSDLFPFQSNNRAMPSKSMSFKACSWTSKFTRKSSGRDSLNPKHFVTAASCINASSAKTTFSRSFPKYRSISTSVLLAFYSSINSSWCRHMHKNI